MFKKYYGIYKTLKFLSVQFPFLDFSDYSVTSIDDLFVRISSDTWHLGKSQNHLLGLLLLSMKIGHFLEYFGQRCPCILHASHCQATKTHGCPLNALSPEMVDSPRPREFVKEPC